MLKIENVSFRYQREADLVLDELNLNVVEGSFVSVIGHSGCGKSTLIRLVAGLMQPSSGLIENTDTSEGMQTAVVFQDYSLFPWMTARQNIVFGILHSRETNRKEAQQEADHYLELIGMEQEANKYPCELSGGMRQRIAIARAFAMDTDLLLMDEPFGALDIMTRKNMQNLLLDIWKKNGKKKTILFVTHDIEEAVYLSQRVILLKNGKIAADYGMEEMKPQDRGQVCMWIEESL